MTLESKYGISIQLPSQRSTTDATDIVVSPRVPGANMASGVREIEKICGIGGPSKVVTIFMFRRVDSGSYQLLLQFRTGTWTIPNGMIGEEEDVSLFALGLLRQQCGEGPPYEQLDPLDSVNLKGSDSLPSSFH